jgi:uncharacterized alpha/beta hydrolase family protein
MYWDICNFLGHSSTGDLTKRLMSDYKDGKAYSYFTSGIVLISNFNFSNIKVEDRWSSYGPLSLGCGKGLMIDR